MATIDQEIEDLEIQALEKQAEAKMRKVDQPISKENSPLDLVRKALDYGSGLERTVVGYPAEKAISQFTGKKSNPTSFKESLEKALVGNAPSTAESYQRQGISPGWAALAGAATDAVLSPSTTWGMLGRLGMPSLLKNYPKASVALRYGLDPLGEAAKVGAEKASHAYYGSAMAPADLQASKMNAVIAPSQIARENNIVAGSQPSLIDQLKDLIQTKNTARSDKIREISPVYNVASETPNPFFGNTPNEVEKYLSEQSTKPGYRTVSDKTKTMIEKDLSDLRDRPMLTPGELQEIGQVAGESARSAGAFNPLNTAYETAPKSVEGVRLQKTVQGAYKRLGNLANEKLTETMEKVQPGSGKEFIKSGKELQSLYGAVPALEDALKETAITKALKHVGGLAVPAIMGSSSYAYTHNPGIAALLTTLGLLGNTTAAKTYGGLAGHYVAPIVGGAVREGARRTVGAFENRPNPWTLLPEEDKLK